MPITRKRQIIKSETDIIVALSKLRTMLEGVGFGELQISSSVTAASELLRNIDKYAGSGWVQFDVMTDSRGPYLEFTATDHGPGIADPEQAMADHFSSSGTLGLGLPGVKRMVDDFTLSSDIGVGTTASFKLWKG